MITHNGKYLPFATHHGMPIYAATMGGEMVIRPWLLSATLQAIVAAFGAEGTEVITKTYDYLNRIATTDTQRALQISGFINEDPMLVCSLVETSKTRWLVGDGKCYIYTDVELSNNLGFIIKSQSTNVNASNTVVYGSGGGGRLGLSYYNTETSYVLHYNSTYHVESNFPNQMEIHTFSHNVEKGKFYVDGQLYDSWTWTSNPSGKMGLFAVSTNSESSRARVAFVEFVDNQTNDQVAHFIPMQRTDGTCGMLDIISGTFYPNANTQGSFTIALTPAPTS